MRNLDKIKLKQWMDKQGPLGREDLAYITRIKFFTLDRILRGVREASELEQAAICQATGMERDSLFPLAKQEQSA